jgi:hypothetical protein
MCGAQSHQRWARLAVLAAQLFLEVPTDGLWAIEARNPGARAEIDSSMDSKAVITALMAAIVGGLIAHLLTGRRERRRELREQLLELARRVGNAQQCGLRLALALETGDDSRVDDVFWQLNEQTLPILMYGWVFAYRTPELRDATAKLLLHLARLRLWKDAPERAPEETDSKGPLAFWRQDGDLHKELFDAFEKEFRTL